MNTTITPTAPVFRWLEKGGSWGPSTSWASHEVVPTEFAKGVSYSYWWKRAFPDRDYQLRNLEGEVLFQLGDADLADSGNRIFRIQFNPAGIVRFCSAPTPDKALDHGAEILAEFHRDYGRISKWEERLAVPQTLEVRHNSGPVQATAKARVERKGRGNRKHFVAALTHRKDHR